MPRWNPAVESRLNEQPTRTSNASLELRRLDAGPPSEQTLDDRTCSRVHQDAVRDDAPNVHHRAGTGAATPREMIVESPAPAGRLLIVDDESTLVTALLSTLREHGYTAIGATTPTDALEIIKRQPVDVMLTDLHLPEMDGIALLRAALQIDPGLSVIMMTGFGTIDTAVDAMKAGAV